MLSSSDLPYFVALNEVDGIGPQRLNLMIKYFGSAKAAWGAPCADLLKIGLNSNLVERVQKKRRQVDPVVHLQSLGAMGVKVITFADSRYPKSLLQVEGRPNLLYVKGEIFAEDEKALAVVGTRKPTAYGVEVTQKLVMELVGYGFTIISGLARGIDKVAHQTALISGGRTIAIMGTGIDQIYPPENKLLAQEVMQHGALVSEFPPGYIAVPGNFPARNRIISGMSLGVVVIEGSSKSGTKITATHALEQGREVFAVPGPITSEMSQAPTDLIKLGAKVVTSVNDILEELKIQNSKFQETNKFQIPSSKFKTPKFDNELEAKVYQILKNGQMHVDEIVRSINEDLPQVSAVLTMMEVKGLVKHLGGMVYCRN